MSKHESTYFRVLRMRFEQSLTSANLARWVASRSALLLLFVPVLLSTVSGKGMAFVAPLSLSLSSFGLFHNEAIR